jgi:hypothetical protein|tara:strand:- start:206 stop:433 length:228 start_codon:yes stop_codon:yes gene_type:complete
MNWIEIDKLLRSMVSLYNDPVKLFEDVKKKFGWNDSQTKAALSPMMPKDSIKTTVDKPKRKRRTKAEMEAARKNK